MFFKEIKLKKNGLSWKLYHYVFPWAPRFDNYCPHFWLSILAGILFIPAVLVRTTWKVLYRFGCGFVIITDAVADVMESFAINSLEGTLFGMSNEETAQWIAWKDNDWNDDIPITKCQRKRFTRLKKAYWKLIEKKPEYSVRDRLCEKIASVGFDYEKWRAEVIARADARRAKIELEAKRRAETIERIETTTHAAATKMMPYAKVLSIIILIPVALWLAYWICMIIGWMFYWTAYFVVVHGLFTLCILGLLAGAVGACFVAYFVGRGLIRLFALIPYKQPLWLCHLGQWILRYILTPLGNSLLFILLLFGGFCAETCPRLGSGVASFFKFFWNMLMAWKHKNCPAIIWEE